MKIIAEVEIVQVSKVHTDRRTYSSIWHCMVRIMFVKVNHCWMTTRWRYWILPTTAELTETKFINHNELSRPRVTFPQQIKTKRKNTAISEQSTWFALRFTLFISGVFEKQEVWRNNLFAATIAPMATIICLVRSGGLKEVTKRYKHRYCYSWRNYCVLKRCVAYCSHGQHMSKGSSVSSENCMRHECCRIHLNVQSTSPEKLWRELLKYVLFTHSVENEFIKPCARELYNVLV
jgi:hypothetical protein